MTYLEIMNAIGARLRHPQAFTEVTSTEEQARLFAAAINDTKRKIESAHDWRVLDKVVEVQTAAGVRDYNLTGLNFTDRWSLQHVYDVSNNSILQNITKERIDRQRDLSSTSNGNPGEFIIKPPVAPATTLPRIEFNPTPDGAYDINVYVNAPDPDLVNNTDRPLVSSHLIILGAYADLYVERGEAVSTQPLLNNPIKQFEDALHEAISRDQELQGEDVGFFVRGFGTERFA